MEKRIEIFAKNLKRLRKQNCWTQDELAQKLYVTRQAVSNWEQGRGCPDFTLLLELSEIFNLSVNKLFCPIKCNLISVFNPAGGTGKSTFSAFLSNALKQISKNESILCINATEMDQAAIILNNYQNLESTFDLTACNVRPYKTSCGVDTIKLKDLEIFLQISEAESIMELMNDYSSQYDYIICDCGRGYDSKIKKKLLQNSSKIFYPLGENYDSIPFLKYLGTIFKQFKTRKEIHLVNSIGIFYNTFKTLNAESAADRIISEQEDKLNLKIKEVNSVIHYNQYINNYRLIKDRTNFFKSDLLKDLRADYIRCAKEVFNIV